MEQKKMLTFFFEKKLMPMEPWRRSREDLTTDEAWAETLGRQKNKERSGPVWKNSCATKPISPAGVTLNICTSPPHKKIFTLLAHVCRYCSPVRTTDI